MEMDKQNDITSESDYNNMFVIGKEKCSFYDPETKQISTTHNQKRDSFDLMNYDVYHKRTGELLKRDSQRKYNSCFIIKLDLMYTMDVEDFLNYQYSNSKNPKEFLKYVKYCTGDIKGDGKKLLIKDWVKSIENKKDEPIDVISKFFGELNKYIFANRVNDNIEFIKEIQKEIWANGQLMTFCNNALNEIISSLTKEVNPIFKNYIQNEIDKINSELLDAKQNGVWNDTRLIATNLKVLDVFKTFENDFYKLTGTKPNTTENINKTQNKEVETSTSIDNKDEEKKELHNNIFKGNSFLIFEEYYNRKVLSVNSRTDLRLLYELLKKDSYFLDTIELKHYIKWLNNNDYYNNIELKSIVTTTKKNIARTNDYKQIKTDLKITLN